MSVLPGTGLVVGGAITRDTIVQIGGFPRPPRPGAMFSTPTPGRTPVSTPLPYYAGAEPVAPATTVEWVADEVMYVPSPVCLVGMPMTR